MSVDLHKQNRNSPESVGVARMLVAFSKIEQERCWRKGQTIESDRIAVPMEQWNEVVVARHRVVKKNASPQVEALLVAFDSVRLSQSFRAATRTVDLTIEEWIALCTAFDAAITAPGVVISYATERFIQTGRFS